MDREFVAFLAPEQKPLVQATALTALIGLSTDPAEFEKLLFGSDVLGSVIRLLSTTADASVRELVLRLLINASAKVVGQSESALDVHPMYSDTLLGKLANDLRTAESDFLHTSRCALVLSNLASTEAGVSRVWAALRTGDDERKSVQTVLRCLVEAFMRERSSFSHGYLLRNVSQLHDVRENLVVLEGFADLLNLLRIDTLGPRRLIVAEILRNCAFDTGVHALLCDVRDLLVSVLWPLAGPEELSADENDSLPLDLQYLERSKVREGDEKVRIALVEGLYQLCATSVGRVLLRENGAYYLLREYHKWENAAEAELICGNVIGLLIRTEEEIGAENLKEI